MTVLKLYIITLLDYFYMPPYYEAEEMVFFFI